MCNPPVQQHHKRGGERKLQWSANWAVVEPCINRLKSQEFLSWNWDANTSFLLLVWTELCSRGKFLLSNLFFFFFPFSGHSRSWISKFFENRISVKIFNPYIQKWWFCRKSSVGLLLLQSVWKWLSFDIWWNPFWVPTYYRTSGGNPTNILKNFNFDGTTSALKLSEHGQLVVNMVLVLHWLKGWS